MNQNHPNRNPNGASRAPTGAEVRKLRLMLDLTPGQAGALIHERASRWLAFENDTARMHPASWELFQRKTEKTT